jgi:hypothetical protein
MNTHARTEVGTSFTLKNISGFRRKRVQEVQARMPKIQVVGLSVSWWWYLEHEVISVLLSLLHDDIVGASQD